MVLQPLKDINFPFQDQKKFSIKPLESIYSDQWGYH